MPSGSPCLRALSGDDRGRAQCSPQGRPVLVLANLHGEAVLAGMSAGRGATLPRVLLQRLSATGTLLRVFCTSSDRLWTPQAVDPRCLPEVPSFSDSGDTGAPTLIHGEPPALAPGEQLRPWMSSPVGHCVAASQVAVAQRVCHRRFGLELSEILGLGLPGARMVSSVEELQRHLADEGAGAAPDGRWVLKPPMSAAGRGQLLSPNGAALGDPSWRGRVVAAFELHGEMLFEPWLDRVHDLGCRGEVLQGSVKVLGMHGLVVGPTGHFAGVLVAPAGCDDERLSQSVRGFTPAVAAALSAVTEQVGQALVVAGYEGPFGVDAFTHRLASGELVFRGLCEINARLTFGRVAAEWLQRAAPEAEEPARLLFARGPLDAAVEQSQQRRSALDEGGQSLGAAASRSRRVVPLLTPDGSHSRAGTSAWLELGCD
ncbi:MAG: hypothetical protein ACI9EF_000106 [Pseudohongiellaceae bacterium]|jgi:hypothetical protein